MRPLGQFRPGVPQRTAARPHTIYKAEMRARLNALAPGSVLDVGCGGGELLRELKFAGCSRCTGVDVEIGIAEGDLVTHGIEWVEGKAEDLPFSDKSFDVVVLEYTAHHVADLDAGLLEAARVASQAVIVLEPWYDLSLPSQVSARDYDEWCKSIDRKIGLIHNPCPSLGMLAAPLQSGGYSIEAVHRLILQPLSIHQIALEARAHLDRLSEGRQEFEDTMTHLLGQAATHGISDDGALLLIATAS